MSVDIEKLETLAKGCSDEVIRSHGWAGMIDDADLLRRDEEFLKECSPDAVLELIAELKSLRDYVTSPLRERMAERESMRAELAGLKTGYEAYERVNAELRAECEALRNSSSCVDDLSALVRKLVHHLRKAAPDNDLPEKALDYLKRKGLQGSPMREIGAAMNPEAAQ